MDGAEPLVAAGLSAGVVAGLWLLVRGMRGYRTAARIGDTGTSRIATLAAGEVRVSGRIESAEVMLVSPLQSAPCVYYRSTIEIGDDDLVDVDDLVEERAVGFRVSTSRATCACSRAGRAGTLRSASTIGPGRSARSRPVSPCDQGAPSRRRRSTARPPSPPC